MNNNTNPKSNTKQYSTTRYTPRRDRGRRHNQNKMVFFVLLALLIIALIVAIALVIADLVGTSGDDTTDGYEGEGTRTPGLVSDSHAMSNAYDGKPETYMLSVTDQSAGSFFSCEFEALADVGKIIFVSDDPEYYIRGCNVQLKVDGEWKTIGDFTASGTRTYTISAATFNATAVRILLTADADALWAINELTLEDKGGNPIKLRSPSAGTNTTPTSPDDTTNTADTTTSQGGSETTSPSGGSTTTVPVVSGYTTIQISNESLYTGSLILVNSQYAYRFPASTASLLNVYNEYYANDYHCNYFVDSAVQLEAVAARAVLQMANGLYTQIGLNNLQVGTGYRSYETQQDLSNRYPATAALPGYSEHHTGLGIDLQVWDKDKKVTYTLDDPNQTSVSILSWMNSNAYKYGFVRRFAPDKDAITGITSDRWHFRYVGVPHAYYMTANNLCLEEYLAALENCTYEGNHLVFEVDGKSYEIYFVAAENGATTTLPVPNDPTSYTVSGNNYSGYIVTVTRG
jgi:D-alanyl-D-alanine carboxypeptidase